VKFTATCFQQKKKKSSFRGVIIFLMILELK